MKKFIYALLFLIVLTGHALFVNGQSQVPTAKLDSIFADWNKPGVPGAAVGVIYKGKLVYAKGFGEADLETGTANSPQTIFHVASVSKQFTAYAIVMLAREGKLFLDDDIRKYIPEVPDFGKKITIRHLIHHTSGLRDQWNLLALAGWQLDDVITKDHVFNLIKRQKDLNFEPGSAYMYCNTGYTLLAETVARITKQPFPEWMDQHVFKPFGMKSTLFYDDSDRIVKGRAYSFHKSPAGAPDPFQKSILSYANVGATSLFTTVNDLALWIENFRSPKVGGADIMTQMLERGRLTKGDTLPYAFGLAHGKYKGLAYYGHNGADAGFRSSINYFPKQDYGFIVLSNQSEFNPEQKVFEMANVFLSKEFKEEKAAVKPVAATSQIYKIDTTLFKQYAGAYELKEQPGFVLSFERKGARYFTQATGQGQVEMFPSSDSTFFLKVVEASVIFHRSKDGKTDRITLRQNGDHPAARVQTTPDAVVKKEQFVGKYYSPELETFYNIRLENDALKLVHVHHGEVDLKLINSNSLQAPWWFVRNIDISRDASGQITGLRMSTGRVMNLWFKKIADDFGSDVPLLQAKKL